MTNHPLPSFQALVSLLRLYAASKSISESKALHTHIRNRGLETSPILGGLLVQIYGDCGSLEDAYDAFSSIHPHSVFSWNVMIRAYTKMHGNKDYIFSHLALSSLQQMQHEGLEPNTITFMSFLTVCLSSMDEGAIQEGRKTHVYIRESDSRECVMVRNGLLNMYGKKGCFKEVRREFDDMDERNVVSWTSIMATTLPSTNAEMSTAQICMKETMSSATQPCRNDEMSIRSSTNDKMCSQSWMNNKTYAESLAHDRMSTRPKAYACETTLGLFHRMQQEGILPDKVAFCTAIDACCVGESDLIIEGIRAHACIMSFALNLDVVLGTSVVHMYGKCGHLELANASFHDISEKNVITWTAMIELHARNEKGEEAFRLFEQMKCEGILPNKFTVVSVLDATGSVEGAISKGKHMHSLILNSQFDSDLLVDAAIINMYGKCHSVEDSQVAFDRLDKTCGVVVWAALIAVFVQNQEGMKALECFTRMMQEGIEPNRATFVSVFDACAKNGSLQDGRRTHVITLETQLDSDVLVGNAIIDMYSKCGCLQEAKRGLAHMGTKDKVTWNTLVTTCARHGHGNVALDVFYGMVEQGVVVDQVSFLSIISSCSHTGLVDEGLQCFALMYQNYGIEPVRKHYNSLIDLLGRAGRLDEAENLTESMSPQANLVSLMTLLGACKQPGEVCRGERIITRALDLNLDSCMADLMLSKVSFASKNNDQTVV